MLEVRGVNNAGLRRNTRGLPFKNRIFSRGFKRWRFSSSPSDVLSLPNDPHTVRLNTPAPPYGSTSSSSSSSSSDIFILVWSLRSHIILPRTDPLTPKNACSRPPLLSSFFHSPPSFFHVQVSTPSLPASPPSCPSLFLSHPQAPPRSSTPFFHVILNIHTLPFSPPTPHEYINITPSSSLPPFPPSFLPPSSPPGPSAHPTTRTHLWVSLPHVFPLRNKQKFGPPHESSEKCGGAGSEARRTRSGGGGPSHGRRQHFSEAAKVHHGCNLRADSYHLTLTGS
ncbi:hypothetical protein E2C01_038955 [Portunus trituberculatus]|uniref:Uncharacterized protein n=1 Tax=Portunus trituberculatus TaxID=210409 RepID=A0A5B7FCB5_PORTR|nr:hypothetical protein [Portunus trituberculatus]